MTSFKTFTFVLCLAFGALPACSRDSTSNPNIDIGDVSQSDASTPDAFLEEDLGQSDSAMDSDLPDAMMPPEEDLCGEWASVFPPNVFDVDPSQAAQIQALLDEHGVIRLAAGADYATDGPQEIRLSSDQQILSLGKTSLPNILVSAGTSHAKVRGFVKGHIKFEPGALSHSNCFMSARNSGIEIKGASVERNLFVDFGQTVVDVDTSMGGVFRDNRFIKINSHGSTVAVRLVGDSERTSGGNVFLLTDTQTPTGSPFLISDQSDVTFAGVNAEGYNWQNDLSDPSLFRVRNTGTFRGSYFVGTSRAGTAQYPMLDLDAESIFLRRTGSNLEAPQVRLGPNANYFFSWENGWDAQDIDDQATNGLRIHAFDQLGDTSVITLNDTQITAPPEASVNTKVHGALIESRDGKPWPIPSFSTIPDPAGPDWMTERTGKPDDRAAIQAMLDADDGLAQLEGRTYYIGGPLVLGRDDRLIGAGMDKTTIIALDPDIDLIHIEWGDPNECGPTTGPFMVAEMTLQGGSSGINGSYPGVQVNQAVLSHVTFRAMSTAGIRISGTYGWDNNFFDHLNFVACALGILQEGEPRPSDACYAIGEWSTMSYIDKTVFYRNQFMNCGQAVAMRPTRSNNLNGFIESRFAHNSGAAIELNYANSGTMIASCLFEDNDASPVVTGPSPILNCEFIADRGESMVGPAADVEGSVFRLGQSTTATIFGNVAPGDIRNANYVSISNSTSDMPIGDVESTVPIAGLYLNNSMPLASAFGDFMTVLDYRTQGTPFNDDDAREIYSVIDGDSVPGSQLLFQRAKQP